MDMIKYSKQSEREREMTMKCPYCGCDITYPIAGAFVDWLMTVYSQDVFIRLYKSEKNYVQEIERLLRKPIEKIEEEFCIYVNSQPYSDETRKCIETEVRNT